MSEGARSSATRTDGCSGVGYAGLGLADDVRDHPPLDVAQVRDPLGHQPAHVGEHADELVDGGAHGADQRSVPAFSRLRTAERSPLSRASPALAVSTSVAAPLARAAVRASPSATAVAASSYAARAASASAKPPSPKPAMAAGSTSPRTTTAGARARPGTTGVPGRRCVRQSLWESRLT